MKKEVTEFLTWPGMYGSGLIAPLMKIGILMFCVAGRGITVTFTAGARTATTSARAAGTTTQGFGAPELNFIIVYPLMHEGLSLRVKGNLYDNKANEKFDKINQELDALISKFKV